MWNKYTVKLYTVMYISCSLSHGVHKIARLWILLAQWNILQFRAVIKYAWKLMVWGSMSWSERSKWQRGSGCKLPESWDKTRKRVTWVVSQLAVTQAGEPQVEQLGASSSLGSLRGVCQESGGKSLSSNKWSVNTVCHMQMNPIWYLSYLRCNSKCHSLQRV